MPRMTLDIDDAIELTEILLQSRLAPSFEHFGSSPGSPATTSGAVAATSTVNSSCSAAVPYSAKIGSDPAESPDIGAAAGNS
jgi:hypothetical protein